MGCDIDHTTALRLPRSVGRMRNVVFILLVLPIVAVFVVCGSALLVSAYWLFDWMALPLLPSFILSLIAGLIALALRRWRLAGAAAAATVFALALAWPWTQATSVSAANAARFTLLQYNVYYRNAALDQVAQRIEAIDADIVVLLEVTAEGREKLRSLDAHYPQRFECWQSRGCDILVFSRFPIKEPHIDFVGTLQRSPIAWFEISPAGCGMNIFATHLTRPFPFAPISAQDKQADDLAAALRGWPGPKLLVGDLNAVPWGRVVKTVTNQANLHVSLGSSGTWHAKLPPLLRLPIDHIMATEGFGFASRKVLTLVGSDHAAVLTEVAIEDRTRCW
jgi:endonuclease/exonuclease/phosphatase (EEP) superfamily protein YafD